MSSQQTPSSGQQNPSSGQQPQTASPAPSSTPTATQLIVLAAISSLAQRQPLFNIRRDKPHKLKTRKRDVLVRRAAAPLQPGQLPLKTYARSTTTTHWTRMDILQHLHLCLKGELRSHVVGRDADADERLRKWLEFGKSMAATYFELVDAKSALNRAINLEVAGGVHPAGPPSNDILRLVEVFERIKIRFDDQDDAARALIPDR